MSLGKDHAVEIDKQQAMDFLKSHNRFLLVGHEHPDGDDVGSICALHNVLLSMGKEADMVLPDPVPRVYTLVETSAQVMTSIPEGKDYDASFSRTFPTWKEAEILISRTWTASASTITEAMKDTPITFTCATTMQQRQKCLLKCSSTKASRWTRTHAMPFTWPSAPTADSLSSAAHPRIRSSWQASW